MMQRSSTLRSPPAPVKRVLCPSPARGSARNSRRAAYRRDIALCADVAAAAPLPRAPLHVQKLRLQVVVQPHVLVSDDLRQQVVVGVEVQRRDGPRGPHPRVYQPLKLPGFGELCPAPGSASASRRAPGRLRGAPVRPSEQALRQGIADGDVGRARSPGTPMSSRRAGS
jgi:hypothetical protein